MYPPLPPPYHVAIEAEHLDEVKGNDKATVFLRHTTDSTMTYNTLYVLIIDLTYTVTCMFIMMMMIIIIIIMYRDTKNVEHEMCYYIGTICSHRNSNKRCK
jgi:hypothetical protein